MLKIDNLSKSFGTKRVIKNVSFTVGHGEIAVLLGPSGVGKSTILRILNNLESVDGGNIWLDDKLLDFKVVNKNHTIGMVFQQFNLFDHLTVIQNIALPLEKTGGKSSSESLLIAQNLLEYYGLGDKATNYIYQLSGGQKQRLAIARTIALKPKVVCFDEPTSALDPLLTAHVAASIKQLAQDGFIVIVSTHDPSLVQRLNATIYLMAEGEIVESATWTAVSENKLAFPQIRSFLHVE